MGVVIESFEECYSRILDPQPWDYLAQPRSSRRTQYSDSLRYSILQPEQIIIISRQSIIQ